MILLCERLVLSSNGIWHFTMACILFRLAVRKPVLEFLPPFKSTFPRYRLRLLPAKIRVIGHLVDLRVCAIRCCGCSGSRPPSRLYESIAVAEVGGCIFLFRHRSLRLRFVAPVFRIHWFPSPQWHPLMYVRLRTWRGIRCRNSRQCARKKTCVDN